MDLQFLDAGQVTAATPWPALIDALRDAFRHGGTSPVRHHHTIPVADRGDATLLVMPAWNASGAFGVKLATIAPWNTAQGLPTLHGVYVLFDGATGRPRAVLDAGALTARRTAAASALASRYLSRADASVLLVIGTGRVARQLIAAHCAVRPISAVRIWGRNAAHASEAAQEVSDATGVHCEAVADLKAATVGAHIICSATSAETALLRGDWVEPGTHVDLVGAYTPAMCEADAATVAKADQVWVDTLDGARDEAGELIQAIESGGFAWDRVAGDLYAMTAQDGSLRTSEDEITLYKSVGAALQDLAAASLCVD